MMVKRAWEEARWPTTVSADWVLPVGAEPIADGAIAIADGRIAAVGPAAELGPGRRFEGAAIVPGFVNAHTHLEYSAYAGFGDGLPFSSWLTLHVRRKRRLEPADVLALARAGAAECLASGVTTVADASFSGAAAPACAEFGLRAIVCLEVFGRDPVAAEASLGRLRAEVESSLSDRVLPGVSPHAPYTASHEVYALCAAQGLPLVTHLAESAAEHEWLTAGRGPLEAFREHLVPPPGETGIRHLARHGLLGPGLVGAHCVTVDEEEIDLLRRHDVAVAHCPRSNALLGCGVAPLRRLLDAGVRVGLGTDSPASTPSFDMFDELRFAAGAARAREHDAGALSAGQALELATLGSARALGLAGEIGSLAPGKRADLAVVSLEGSPFLPWEDPAAAVVFGGSPTRVVATLVGGEVLYEQRTFRWHDLRQDAASARSRMLRASGSQEAGAAAAARRP